MTKTNHIQVVTPTYKRPPPKKARPKNPNLDSNGAEIGNPISLVALADMRPPTLGERVRRYLRNADYSENDFVYDDDDFDEMSIDPDNPMSPYEDRAHDIVRESKAKKAARLDAQKKLDEEKADIEAKALQKRLDELRQKSATPTPPAPGAPTEAP